MPLTNEQIASLFEDMAALLEIKGDTIFKIRAYQRAARAIGPLSFPLDDAVHNGMNLKELPGIGDAISKKVQELVTTGEVQAYERLKAELPEGILTLMNIPGIGPRTASLISRELGASTIDAVERAALDGRLAEFPRMGEKTAQNILRHIRSLRTKDQRMPIGEALPVAEGVISALKLACPAMGPITYAGSLRRWKETVGDIDIIGTSQDPGAVTEAFARLPMVQEVLGQGSKKASVVVSPGLQVDLRIVDGESFGAMVQYFTGSQQHNLRLRDYANQMGLSLNEYGVTVLETGTLEKYSDEEAFYARLGLPLIPPEIREGLWELDLARRDHLPRLVQMSDLKGDLHVHSDWTDGQDSLESMISAAADRGYQYLALTDHSGGRGIANGLTADRLLHQMEALRSLEDRYPIKVLYGSEVDIRADGSLDYPDDFLEGLDVVVASVHSSLGQDAPTMTRRLIRAMEHPCVTVIGHPTCRLLGSRQPVELDMEAVFQSARETGTALEINSSPERLDLRDSHVLRAQELGVPLVISTDAHTITRLDMMRFGVGVARRGWCEAEDILNTLPAGELLAFLETPKSRRTSLLASRKPEG